MNGPKVCIVSDFVDYYDYAFDSILESYDIRWHRHNGAIPRRDIFKSLDGNGLMTPLHGLVEKVAPILKEENKDVVIYTNEIAHNGTGKIKLPASMAMEWEGHYCSEYISPPDNDAISFRLLRIGNKNWLLRYTATNSWMSNISNSSTSIEILNELRDSKNIYKNVPIISIDYVMKDTFPYYIDINLAPYIGNTGIDSILSPDEIYRLVKEYYIRTNNDAVWGDI